jgi:6-pyruvoyltetrahydropterin/6-carboxytetrahydropterin synthase
VLVTLAGAELDETGLLLDFKLLKNLLKPVVDYLDHRMINDLAPFTELNPSAENLARYFYDETSRQLQALTAGRVQVKDCTVFETDTSFARYYE